MDKLESLMSQYPNITFDFEPMPMKLGGLTVDKEITINSNKTKTEQFQWLLEELGHVETSVGDISDYNEITSMRQEHAARKWGFTHYLSEKDLKDIVKEHPENDYEVAEDLGLQIPYLHEIGFTYGFNFKHATD
ncbi:hypothetical protein [Lactobacillus plantarum subsp. plantarum] [Lactiplantibacillus mudanjiangensis]|uniref:ImmA/IrrE family metallo-endopeptidase n=1 Tax=Lactiplantibacillus mudanjiangensis TaxID=1296538 RepID=UPI001015B370|nr:ImmA/IrrE family metallo-endopeptidase [Lactiplantibacillus mudanjiangensis]VDG33332.1 hypothetical protein [Lactobacillus plantarum subsp. plantarum] [Lactiplantibacillus mudanjiangensis]